MARLSNKQIEQARSADLLEYLGQHEPGSYRPTGTTGEYCLVKHDSFKISNGKWNWHSQKFGGIGALDYLVKVKGVGFVDAVLFLTGGLVLSPEQIKSNPLPFVPKNSALSEQKSSKPMKPATSPISFRPPTPNTNNDKAIAYLRSRGICKDIISRCIQMDIIYESRYFNTE